jgi:hypothetical protein
MCGIVLQEGLLLSDSRSSRHCRLCVHQEDGLKNFDVVGGSGLTGSGGIGHFILDQRAISGMEYAKFIGFSIFRIRNYRCSLA